MEAITFILALSVAAYVAIAWLVTLSLSGTPTRAHVAQPISLPSVVVVVAARNEETRIGKCLESLATQDYPEGLFQIVVVDDRSEDATPDIVRQYSANNGRITLVEWGSSPNRLGKAGALARGIASSSAEVILTTDADCIVPPRWVIGMVSRLRGTGLACLGGPTVVAGRSVWARVQALDWILGFAVVSESSVLGHPITAMGNNMAFTRREYDDVGGYRQYSESPTEDYALFIAMAARSGGAVVHLDPEVLVRTEPEHSLAAAIAQRRRWARGGLRAPALTYALYAVAWLAHVLPVAVVPLVPVTGMVCCGLKLAADAVVIAHANRRLGRRTEWLTWPLFELFLWAYIAIVPISLLLVPTLSWKGRRI